jgi:hypothetical protein
VNGRYGLVTTREERLAIACIAAQHAYKKEFPQGVAPGVTYLAAFLKPFLDRECLQSQLDELHRPARIIVPRERELVQQLTELIAACNKKIDATGRHK